MRWPGWILAAFALGAVLLLLLGAVEIGPDASPARVAPPAAQAPMTVHLEGRSRAGDSGTEEASDADTEAEDSGALTVIVVGKEAEAPVAGARIVFRRETGSTARVLAEGTTDAAGRVTWHDLEPVFGTLLVEAEGYGRVHTHAAVFSGLHEERRVVLPPGRTWRGVVVDAVTDRRVEGALVRLFPVEAPGMSKDVRFAVGVEWDRVLTDARGVFSFEGCAESLHLEYVGLEASTEGYAPATKIAFGIRDLVDGRGIVLGLPPAGRVEGRILGPEGEGRPGDVWAAPARFPWLLEETVDVRLLPDGDALWWHGFDMPDGLDDLYGPVRIASDETGRFAFTNLPLASEVVVQARVGGVRTQREELRVETMGEAVVLAVPRAGRIEVLVRGPDGRPSHRAYVKWKRRPTADSTYPVLEESQRRTDEHGRAVFEVVTPGPFDLTLWGNGLLQEVRRGVLEPGETVSIEIDARPEHTARDSARDRASRPQPPLIDPLAPGAAPQAMRAPGVVRIVVDLPDGDPVPSGYQIGFDAEHWTGSSSGPWPEDGRRRLQVDRDCPSGLPATVEAEIDGYLPLRWEIPEGASGLFVLETQPLDRGLAVAGRVVDEGGRPVAGANVLLKTPGAEEAVFEWDTIVRDAVTDAQGRFRLEALSAETLVFEVRVPWYEHRDEIEVRAGLESMRVTIPQRAIVRGRVRTPDGLPAAREEVSIRSADAPLEGRAAWSGYTDRAGRFHAVITKGRWSVAVRRRQDDGPWTTVATTEVEVEPAAEASVVLTVPHRQ